MSWDLNIFLNNETEASFLRVHACQQKVYRNIYFPKVLISRNTYSLLKIKLIFYATALFFLQLLLKKKYQV